MPVHSPGRSASSCGHNCLALGTSQAFLRCQNARPCPSTPDALEPGPEQAAEQQTKASGPRRVPKGLGS